MMAPEGFPEAMKQLSNISLESFAAGCILCCLFAPRPAIAQADNTPSFPLRTSISPPLSLEDAVRLASENNPVLKTSRLDLGMTTDRLKATRTKLLPQTHLTAAGVQLLTPLSFGFGKGVLGTNADGRPIPNKDVSVRDGQRPLLFLNASITQPLLPIGTKIEVRQSKLAREQAQTKLQVDQQLVVNQVKHAYYQAWQLEDSIRVLDATIQLNREVVRMTDQFVLAKTVPLSDALEAKQILARAEYDLVHLQNSLDSAKERLNQLIGRDARTDFSLAKITAAEANEIDLKAAQSLALQNRLEVKQIGRQQAQIDLARKAIKAERVPEINLTMDYISIFGTENIVPKNILFAGLVANVEPIDWGRRRAQISEQNKRLLQTDISLQDLQNQILLEVNDAWQRVQEAKMLLNVSDLGEQTARERLRVVVNKYREKASLLRDVLQAQRDTSQAENQHTQAALALWTAKSDLEKALGEGVK